ncbi:MAG: hypothetical protein V7K21_02195 [Nostoc sp.]|uniref:hypothetical protein n=1 Tax=Nostoc sp. TaxID=1180 RepID=UPI002FF553B2
MSARLLIKPESPHPAKATLCLPSQSVGYGVHTSRKNFIYQRFAVKQRYGRVSLRRRLVLAQD